MSNITKIAPYVYLAKRSSGMIYDLFLLVPVDSKKTVDLSNVEPTSSGNRVFISYNSSNPNLSEAQPQYKAKHWVLNNSENTFVDVQIQADGKDDFTTIITLADADTEPASSTNDTHTFAPYLFIGIELEGESLYFRPSSIVLFEGNVGSQDEGLTFSGNSSSHTLTPGDNSQAIPSPENFAVNQNVRHEISNPPYTFEGIVGEHPSLAKPIRKGKTRKIWLTGPRPVSNEISATAVTSANI